MNLTLYKTVDAKNVLNKILTDPLTLPIKLRKGFNIMTPEIIVSLPNGTIGEDYNYLHLSELDRYYFIDSITRIGVLWKLECSLDVLETYKGEILSSHCKFRRKIKEGDRMRFNSEQLADAKIDLYHSSVTMEGETLVMSTLSKTGG